VSAFFSYLVHGIALGCSFALLASGIIIIYRVTRVVNLAQGTFAVVAAFTTATLTEAGLPHGAAEFVGVLGAATVGLVTGVVAIAKRGTRPAASLIATLGFAILGYAFEILIWGEEPRSFGGLEGSFHVFDLEFPRQYGLVVIVTLIVFGLLELFLERSYAGKALTACASNPFAAKLVGISVVRMGLFGFALGGAFGGVAGILITPLAPLSYDSDVSLFVSGFASAIVAGLERPLLALGGGLVMGVAEALVAGYSRASYQTAFALSLALVLLLVQGLRRPAAQLADE